MLRNFLHAARTLLNANHASVKKISCYHCSDKSIPSRTVYVHFDGGVHAVCCNVCAAILKTVEELGMRDEYLAHKIQIPYTHE